MTTPPTGTTYHAPYWYPAVKDKHSPTQSTLLVILLFLLTHRTNNTNTAATMTTKRADGTDATIETGNGVTLLLGVADGGNWYVGVGVVSGVGVACGPGTEVVGQGMISD